MRSSSCWFLLSSWPRRNQTWAAGSLRFLNKSSHQSQTTNYPPEFCQIIKSFSAVCILLDLLFISSQNQINKTSLSWYFIDFCCLSDNMSECKPRFSPPTVKSAAATPPVTQLSVRRVQKVFTNLDPKISADLNQFIFKPSCRYHILFIFPSRRVLSWF